jgi:predicted TIM-barrel fold metal-dependent hydrolase
VTAPPLVDSHFHLWRADLPLTDTAWHRDVRDATAEQFIDVLDRHGVLFGVVAAASLHGTYNDYVRSALRTHRRLRATATVTPDIDVYQLERMAADGFVGIRLVWGIREDVPDLRTGPYRALLRRIADLGWHVHFTDRPERFASTIATLEEAGIRIVVDHLGLFDTPEGIDGHAFRALMAAVERGRTWVKLSGGFRFQSPGDARAYARALVGLTGGERLMWGSDWPFAAFEDTVTYQSTLDAFTDWVPDPAVRAVIGGTTPLKFYFG